MRGFGRLVWGAVGLWGCSSAAVLGDEGAPDVGSVGHGGAAASGVSVVVSSGPGSGGPSVSSSSSKAASSSGSASTAASSGAGGSATCSGPAQCPGSDTACASRTCSGGACGMAYTPGGKAAGAQVPGDCLENQCDGKGAPLETYAPIDTKPDGNTCTTDGCSMQGPTYTKWGDEKCHGVCVLPPGLVAGDSNGDPVGFFPAGPYATCGFDDLLAPGSLPWKWTFIGVTWTEKIGLNTYAYACGSSTGLAAAGISLSTSTCQKGTQCLVRFYAFDQGVKSYGAQLGTCE